MTLSKVLEDLSLDFQSPHKHPAVLSHTVIPALGRWKHLDPWGLLVNQSNLIGEPQIPVKDPV